MSCDEALQRVLAEGLQQLDVDYTDFDVSQLIHFMHLLSKWNKVYNLTAVTDEASMISHHLLDSIAVLPALYGDRIVDVGAGAGLPGIALAIVAKDRNFFEVESSQKKARFMQQVIMELGLTNVTVVCQRAEKLNSNGNIPAEGSPLDVLFYDTVISRAFASIAKMLNSAGHLCQSQGLILAMKGKMPNNIELHALPDGYICDRVQVLNVPGLEAERHLVHIKRVGRS